MRYAGLLPLALLALLTACSGSDDASFGTSGGGGAAAGGPTGAANMEVYATEEQDCPAGNLHVDLGSVNTSPRAELTDGKEGATVTCSVKATGGGTFEASGAITQGKNDFSFGDVMTDGTSAAGWVRFVDPATGTGYKSSSGKPCVFQFAPSTDQGVGDGHVFMQFDCSDLVNESDSSKVCSSRYGYVLLTSCEGGA